MTAPGPSVDTHAMPTLGTTYIQRAFKETPEYQEVCAISDKLLKHLNKPDAQELQAQLSASARLRDEEALTPFGHGPARRSL
jgi:hypothetical protein